jgi:hypothetical protein
VLETCGCCGKGGSSACTIGRPRRSVCVSLHGVLGVLGGALAPILGAADGIDILCTSSVAQADLTTAQHSAAMREKNAGMQCS